MTLFLEMKMINDKRISDQIHSGSTPDFLEVYKILSAPEVNYGLLPEKF